MKTTLKLLILMISAPSLASVSANPSVKVERERSGGIVQIQTGGIFKIEVEETSVAFEIAERTELGNGEARVTFGGEPSYIIYVQLYRNYMEAEPSQVLTFLDRQIIYGRGIACARKFTSASYQDLAQGIFEPNINDRYFCRFVINYRHGFTRSTGMAEPRPRMRFGN